MAIEEEKKLKLSRRVASSWVVISMGVAITIGLVGNAMTSAGALEQLADSETIIVRIASLISQFGVLPALLAGVILAGILAATMSTADSQLLAASSSISQDLGNDFLRCDFSGKRGMLVARTVMLGISLIAAFLARDPDSSVFRVVSFAWAGFCCRDHPESSLYQSFFGGLECIPAHPQRDNSKPHRYDPDVPD